MEPSKPCMIELHADEVFELDGAVPKGAISLGHGRYSKTKKIKIKSWSKDWATSMQQESSSPPPFTLNQALKMGAKKNGSSGDFILDQTEDGDGGYGWTLYYNFDNQGRAKKVKGIHSSRSYGVYEYRFKYVCK